MISEFSTDGFSHIQELTSADEIMDLKDCLNPLLKSGFAVTQNPHNESAGLYMILEQILERVAKHFTLKTPLAIENVIAVTKAPMSSFEVPPHQDGISAKLELDPKHSFSIWFPLIDTNVSNGGLALLKGSHQFGYLPYQYLTDRPIGQRPLAADITGIDLGNAVVPPCDTGDGLVFDVRLLHWSTSNRSALARPAINMRVTDPDGIRRRDQSAANLVFKSYY